MTTQHQNTELPDEWPMQGPDFNAWNKDLSKFASILERAGAFWCMDWPLKYLSLWTDTRDGAFLIFDRDKNKIDANRVIAAIRKWDEETGEFTKNSPAKALQGDKAEAFVRFNDGPDNRYVDEVSQQEIGRLKSKSVRALTPEIEGIAGKGDVEALKREVLDATGILDEFEQEAVELTIDHLAASGYLSAPQVSREKELMAVIRDLAEVSGEWGDSHRMDVHEKHAAIIAQAQKGGE